MNSIKIISDGTPWNTHVLDADTGEEINNVTYIKWEIHLKDELARVTLGLTFGEIEAQGRIEQKFAGESPPCERGQ